ncbi:hypothetical protein [Pseudoalteromonas byunsanensis]|uniref:Hemolysin n=1 Tax=Pseudoalteromonas byunsanensis TaxID=327939 RepID=A0A1S1NGF5_9GAMM|nr:hypothetical protein [Pseudoalteromonas byunsanensis]OHU97603.1 hypothetical protein BIW53_01530 [Pseudoalteromonas byunsanensis]
MYGKLIATSVAAALVHSATAHALPDTTSGNPLSKLGIHTPAGVGDVVQDHENPKTLHVGPANDKEIIGTYFDTGGGPSCSAYVAMKEQANRLPATEQAIKQAIDNGDFVSNYFQLTVGIPARNTAATINIGNKSEEIYNLALANGGLIDRYHVLEAQWSDIAYESELYRDELDTLKDDQAAANNQCIVNSGGDFSKMYECIVGVANTYTPLIEAARAKVKEVDERKDAIREDYYAAKGEYKAFEDKLNRLNSQLEFAMRLYESQLMIVNNAYDIEYKAVTEAGSLIAGIASAGYNLWGNEAAILSNTLRSAGQTDYSVQQLNVFDIRLNSGVTRDNPNISTDDNQPIFRKNVWTYPSNTIINFGNIGDRTMPFERETVGDQIHFDTTTWDSLGSGGIDFHVTKDARCGDYEANVERNYTATHNGTTASWKVTRDEYKPVLNSPVFATNIALSYSYYAYPGKLKGECSIDVDRMNSYWRNAGKSKSWSWFKTKTKSWDHIRTTARDELGMECKLSLVPQSSDPEEAARLAEKFETQMYNDMWQMFLAVYAESYDVIVKDPEITDPGQSDVGKTIGDGLLTVCRNAYCQFANVVLRALDKIGGSKAQGTTSHVSHEYGKIWKRYEKDSFNVYQGSASIKAKVCVDSSQCN